MAFQIVKIPDLPPAASITGSDQYPIETAAGTKRVTQSVVDTYGATKFIRKNTNDTTTGVITAAGFTVTSSEKLKENIQPLSRSVLLALLALEPVRYVFKKESAIKPGQADVGLIAEEVKKYIPELVAEDTNGNLSVDYAKLSVFLLLAVKNLEERLKAVESSKN